MKTSFLMPSSYGGYFPGNMVLIPGSCTRCTNAINHLTEEKHINIYILADTLTIAHNYAVIVALYICMKIMAEARRQSANNYLPIHKWSKSQMWKISGAWIPLLMSAATLKNVIYTSKFSGKSDDSWSVHCTKHVHWMVHSCKQSFTVTAGINWKSSLTDPSAGVNL